MKTTSAFVLFAVFSAASCISVSLSNTCKYASQVPLYQYEPDALTFVLGSPPHPDFEMPFLVLSEPKGESELTVQLAKKVASYDLPLEFDNHQCKNVEVRAFSLEVDSDGWNSYWGTARERGEFAYGVIFPGLDSPVRSQSIGFAFVDNSTRKSAASCGCLAN